MIGPFGKLKVSVYCCAGRVPAIASVRMSVLESCMGISEWREEV
jgi:hypothetical protein